MQSASSLQSALTERIRDFVKQYEDTPEISEFETRRQARRYTMAEPVDIMVDSETSPAEMVFASGRDISDGGIGVYTNRPLPPGTDMIIGINDGDGKFLAKAEVIHSTLSVGMFKIGAKFVV